MTYDHGNRRKAKRSGRETGCWTYVPGEELAKAGFAPGEPAPFYRTWGYLRSPRSGSVVISLYREP